MIKRNVKYGNENITLVELGFGDIHLYTGIKKNEFSDFVLKSGPQVPVGKFSKKTEKVVEKSKMKTEIVMRFHNINSIDLFIKELKSLKEQMEA